MEGMGYAKRGNLEEVARELDEERCRIGWSQSELAREAEISIATVNDLLTGRRLDILSGNLAAIAAAVGMDVALVKGGEVVAKIEVR